MTIRLLLFCGAALAIMTGCATTADLSRHYDAETRSFCGISVGRPLPPEVARRSIWVEPEGMREERLVAELCDGAVTGLIALEEDGAIETIYFTAAGTCLDGVCIGDRFPQVRSRRPDLDLFLAREEGGLLSLHDARRNISYPFDAGTTPARCFEGIDICPAAWNSAKVSAIIVASR